MLDEQYAQIHETPKKRIEIIEAALAKLSTSYKGLVSKNDVSYTNLPIRFAYVYRYVTCHSGMAFQVIRNSKVLRALFKQKLLTVSCIGGGPGSDLLGVLKYAEDVLTDPDSKLEKIRCYLVDGENAWADTWSDVDQKIDLDCSVSTFFLAMRVTEPAQWEVHTKYLQADLFTMVYFVSWISSRWFARCLVRDRLVERLPVPLIATL